MARENFQRIYSGSLIEAILLEEMLNDNGIECYINNEFEKGVHSGFGAGFPGDVEVYVVETDIPLATTVLNDFQAVHNE